MQDPFDAVVVGSGLAGIAMAIKLRQAGIEHFVVLEAARELGGTWRDNTYPGCACDIPSYLYSYSFEPNPGWTRMFAPQHEIWDYTRHCAAKYGISSRIRYESPVTAARFDEDARTWVVETAGGDTYRARLLVTGVGALHVPRYPDIPGRTSFRGTSFHSSGWDHGHDLTGRRVAVIGTGASAIQFVPRIQPLVRHLDLYQRTAAWITPKPDRAIGVRERLIHRRLPVGQKTIRGAVFWLLEGRGVGFALSPRLMVLLEHSARRHLERQVRDPDLRAKLTPHYQIGCKRILISSDFYPAVTRPNVDLVTDEVVEIREHSLVTADGVERPADTIVFATGFDVGANLSRITIVGRGGHRLEDVWQASGRSANLGMTVAGFPNLFLLVGPNTALAHSSMIFMIERQTAYVVDALRAIRRRAATTIEVRPRAQRRFADRVQAKLAGKVWEAGCQSWYLDATGRNSTIWPYFGWQYWLETRRLRTADYEFDA
jgi:cation diffusion facilitator CzcD-associated flavoprotein CzcO